MREENEPPKEKDVIDVGFLFPVINGKLYVAQRGTEPHIGMYGPIGGKSEEHNHTEIPYIKEYPADPHIPRSDLLARERNKEFGHSSAIREFYEEVFQMKEVPWEEVTNIFKIGRIADAFNGTATNCQFYLAMIARNNFSLSPRELLDVRSLDEIQINQLYPLTKASLFGLKKALESGKIKKLEPYSHLSITEQIPPLDIREIFEILEGRTTSIKGLLSFD